uniref:Ig-like domain-containing protein n=1 Tax=Aquimarina sp. I32.4 TaxID=2053903 RepID=UPI0011AF8C6A
AGVVTPVSSGTTDITYTVTDGNGCTSASSAVHTVTVNSLPTAAAITGATAVCMGATIDLTEGTAGTIVWSSSNLAVATIDGSGVVTPVSAGTTDITYTVTDGNGCTSASSAVHTVTVNDLPTAAAITGATAVCMGATIDLTEGTAGTIAWSSSNLAVATIDGAGVVTPVSAGTTDITYTVTDGNGCTSVSSAVHTVTVNSLPTAAAITGATAVCMGATIDLTEGTAGTIVWSSSNLAVATIDGSGVVTPVSAGTTDITYTVTDGNGCTSASSAVHTVTVNSLPTAAAITGATAVCMGATIDLTEGTAGTIVWSSSNLAVATIDGSGVVTPVSSGTTDITYTVTDGNGCTSASSAVHTVTIDPTPIIVDCPSDIIITTNTNNCSVPVTWIPPTTTVNCIGAVSITSTHDSGDMFAVGATTTVTYTFTDLLGNSDSCSFDITVSGIVVATNDIVSLDGDTGDSSSNIVNDNDLFSCNFATLNTDVIITNVTDNNPDDDINLDPLTGIITVLPGTPAGEYLIRYTLCSIDTPTICDEASIIITVTSSGGGDVSNLSLTKTGEYVDTNDDDIVNVGDKIHYSFTVENTGSVDLINIVLTDPLPGVEVIGGPIDLEAGEVDEDNFTAIYTLTEEDLLSGRVTNQATVTGQNPDGNTVTDISDDPSDDTNVDLDGDGDFEDETIVRIRFDEEIIVYSGMSPNGDGVNDVFVIEGIEEFENTLTIFNRWGVKVYESKNYGRDNNFFRGVSNGRSTIEGKEELPVGTYYYVVEYILQSGQRKNKAGYLYLNR